MASWESDQLTAVLKQGNACGAKGPAGEPRSREALQTQNRTKEVKRTCVHDSLEGG